MSRNILAPEKGPFWRCRPVPSEGFSRLFVFYPNEDRQEVARERLRRAAPWFRPEHRDGVPPSLRISEYVVFSTHWNGPDQANSAPSAPAGNRPGRGRNRRFRR
jgi:hypothetical protein